MAIPALSELSSLTSPPPQRPAPLVSRWPVASSLLLLALLSILATLPGWLPSRTLLPLDTLDNPRHRRIVHEHVPLTTFAAQRLADGKIPLWNPYQNLGAPLLASGQIFPFYPTILLHITLPPQWAWTLDPAIRLWLAGAGVWLLARRLGLSPIAGLLAAAAFMLCGHNLIFLHHPQSNLTPLLPWTILLLIHLSTRPSPGRAAALAPLVGLQFLGAPHAMAITFLAGALAAWALHLLFEIDRDPLHPMRSLFERFGRIMLSLPALAVAILIGILLAGAQWVPLYELRQQWGPDAFSPPIDSAPAIGLGRLGYLAGLLSPFALSRGNLHLSAGWVGTLPLLLAVSALVTGWRQRRVLQWLTLSLLALLTAIITATAQPDIASASLVTAALGLALLAGLGLDELLSRVGNRNSAITISIASTFIPAGLAFLFALAGIALMVTRFGGLAGEGTVFFIPALALALLGLSLLIARKLRRGAALPWLGIAAAELIAIAILLNPGSPAPSDLPDPALAFLNQRRIELRQEPFRFAASPADALPPNTATPRQLHDLHGTGRATPPRLRDWRQALLLQLPHQITNVDNPALRLLSLRYLLLPAGTPPPSPQWSPLLSPTEKRRDEPFSPLIVHERRNPLPRAWIVAETSDSILTFDTFAQVRDRLASAPPINPQRTLLLDRQILPEYAHAVDELIRTPAGAGRGQAIIWEEDHPERIRLTIENASGGWLIIADPYVEGWRAMLRYTPHPPPNATGGGASPRPRLREAQISPAYGLLRAIPLVRAQDLTVILEYAPTGWRHGVIATLAGGVGTLLLVGWTLLGAGVRSPR